MAFLKLAYSKRRAADGESPQAFFEHLRGEYSYLLESAAAGSGGAAAGSGDAKAGSGGAAKEAGLGGAAAGSVGADGGAVSGSVGADGGRYSFLGWDPYMILKSGSGIIQMKKRKNFCHLKKTATDQIVEGEPLQVMRDIFRMFEFKGDYPVPYYGGAAGFFSYDFGCALNGVSQKVFDDLNLPDYQFIFTDKNIAFDHEKGEVYFLALAETESAAERKLTEITADLRREPTLRSMGELGKIESNLTAKSYGEKLLKIRTYLEEGQTYQVNFSQRFSADCTYDSWAVYRRLAEKSPAPFACYFDFGGFEVASSSPELLVRKRGTDLETRPIKGTVKRGHDDAEDRKMVAKLLASGKDDAELSMIVDLERNDLGKVCETGSVRVESHREIQKLSHVIHTFSKISGKLGRRKDVYDVIKAVFPGGSITGCPKKRTMEIIDRLEDYKRGIYTGSAGYISFSGDADFNILIRSMLFREGKVYYQVGGGIVIDSNTRSEYRETLQKAEGMLKALSGD